MKHLTKTGVQLRVIEGGGQTTPFPKRMHLFLVDGKEKPGVGWTGWKLFGFTVWNDWYSSGFHVRVFMFEYYSETKRALKRAGSQDDKVS